jgi:hypothetical protein
VKREGVEVGREGRLVREREGWIQGALDASVMCRGSRLSGEQLNVKVSSSG